MNTGTKNAVIWSVVGLALVGAAAYPLWSYFQSEAPTSEVKGDSNASTFTPSAAIAPDGNTATLETALSQGASAFGITVTPFEVTEDSRCPIDVVCIQAGTARVLAKVKTSFGEKDVIFTLGKPEVIDDAAIELILVLPAPRASEPAQKSDYRFTFKVTKLVGTFDVKG